MKEIFKLSIGDDGLPVIECEDKELFEKAIVFHIGEKMNKREFTAVQSLLNIVTMLCITDKKRNFHKMFVQNLDETIGFIEENLEINPDNNRKESKKMMS